MEYFTKWAEAEAFVNIKATTLCQFVQRNIITRFGVPKALVADNEPFFISKEFTKLCKKFGITLHHSSLYYLQGNGQASATNKTLIKIIKKTVENAKGSDWSDKLVNVQWAYRTTVRTATGQTPYALAFEMEAAVPYESLIPSL